MLSEDALIAESIAKNGWHAVAVDDTSPSFVYTCGLITSFGHPELIVLGLDSRTAYPILFAIVENIRSGLTYAMAGAYEDILEDLRIGIGIFSRSRHEFYLGYAMGQCRLAGNIELRAVQIFWPDSHGHLPYEDACDERVRQLQPDLSTKATPQEIDMFRRKLS